MPAGVCGNGVIETGEDCDAFPISGTRCRGPNENNPCRLDCTTSTTQASCPSGWGCGLDGLCRQPLGTFTPGEPTAASSWRLGAGDFDGDGHYDLIVRERPDAEGHSGVRAEFYDIDGVIEQTVFVSIPLRAPAIRDVDGDGRADIVAAYTEVFPGPTTDQSSVGVSIGVSGVAVMLSFADRAIFPVAYPTLESPYAARAIPVTLPDRVEVAAFVSESSTGRVVVGTTELFANLKQTPDNLAGDNIASARLFAQDSNYPCEGVALAGRNDTEVVVLPMCKKLQDGTIVLNEHGTPITVTLSSTDSVDKGVRVADMDGNGGMDLLIGANGKTYVAYGDGKGKFFPNPDLSGKENQASLLELVIDGHAEFNLPLALAVGDVNGDGKPDFIAPDAIYFSSISGTLTTYHSLGNPSLDWSEAIIADMTKDGRPDIIAGSSQTLGIDYLLGTGSDSFNPFSIRTLSNVSRFAVGDFDGDLLPDLAFAEKDLSRKDYSTLKIAFGQAGRPPLPPTVIGHFPTIVQTLPLRPPNRAADYLVVVSKQSTGVTSTSLALLAPNGDRQPLAPFPLPDQSVSTTPLPRTVVPDVFTSSPYPDVAVISQDVDDNFDPAGPLRLWLMKSRGPAEFQPLAPGSSVSLDPMTREADGALATSADLDGDGIPELVMVVPSRNGASLLHVARLQQGTFSVSPAVEIPVAVSAIEGKIELADLDGDGLPDLLLSSGSDGYFGQAPPRVVVFWNNGKGGFDLNPTDLAPTSELPFGVAPIRVKANAPQAVAYVALTHNSDTDLFNVAVNVVQFTPKTRTLSSTVIWQGQEVSAVNPGGDIVAADFNGDGVDDLAVAYASYRLLLLGVPALP
ncbi:MAG: VCBS repeat-containing protein [Myxococcales bacterium]